MKKGKKVVTLLLVLSLLIATMGLIGCGNTATDDKEPAKTGDNATKTNEEIYIGCAALGTENPWCMSWINAFKAECEKQGVKYVLMDGAFDVMVQDQQLGQLIQENPDVLVLWPVDAMAVGPKIKEASAKGIPILNPESMVDESLLDYVTYVGYATWDAGHNGTELLAKALNGKGRILAINGRAGYQVHEWKRLQKDDLAKYPDLVLLDEQPTDSSRLEAEQKMANMLTKWGPDDFDAVYCQDDNSLQGAITAMKARGYNPDDYVYVTGAYFGSSYDLIKSGKQYGTTLIDPRIEAKKVVEVAIQMAKGEKVEKEIIIPVSTVTKDNVDEIKADW